MKINNLKLWLAATLLSTISISSTWAVDKVGNGGGEEIEFKAIETEITDWVQARYDDRSLNQKLRLDSPDANIAVEQFYTKLRTAVAFVGNKIKFQNEPIEIDGYSSIKDSRICGNDSQQGLIICNIANWNAAPPQIKYSIVLHELLGVARIESNHGEYSRYPISSNILKFVKRSDKFELGADPVVQNYCPSLGLNGIWENALLGNPFRFQQNGCMLSILDKGSPRIAYKIPLDGTKGVLPEEFYLNLEDREDRSDLANVTFVVSAPDARNLSAKIEFDASVPKVGWLGIFHVNFTVDFEISGKTGSETIEYIPSQLRITVLDGSSPVSQVFAAAVNLGWKLLKSINNHNLLTRKIAF